MENFTIGRLAELADVKRETVRYYERRRLLPRPPRSMSGYRVFSDDAVKRLGFIKRAKALGFSLNEVRELLALRVNSSNACSGVRARAQAKIGDVDQKIESLQRIRATLTQLVAACARRKKTGECPLLDSLDAPGKET